jgi:hypothetical protein
MKDMAAKLTGQRSPYPSYSRHYIATVTVFVVVGGCHRMSLINET